MNSRIGVFNRSHYEDVLVACVKGFAAQKVSTHRYDHIANFEKMVADEGTTIIKVFLQVSSKDQTERFRERIDRPDKNWKFRAGDLDDRRLWPKFMEAYSDSLEETSNVDEPR